jgi:hypothetical protein
MPNFVYNEKHDDNAVTNFSFDMTGGSAKAYYYLNTVDSSTVQYAVQDILGYTYPFATNKPGQSPANQSMSRLIPTTHPKFPYMYASKIASFVGQGVSRAIRQTGSAPSNPSIGYRPIADYEVYLGENAYEVGVEFTSRPYPILQDGSFSPALNGQWFTKNGSQNNFTYSPEWVRYVDYDFFPQENTIQGQTGQLNLVISGNTDGFVPFTSPPWMWLPDQILKVRWFQVPWRYITSTNSYIAGGPNRNWRGRINQNAWWNWPAGSLLYLGYNVTKYTPPTNDIQSLPTGDPNFASSINYARLCDIELNFLLTNRYQSGSLGATITNKNYVAAGHNLLPNLADNNFYYAVRSVTTPPQTVQTAPAWLSFPLEALFSDPDVAGGPTTAGDN